jgi:transposase InsO family protein
MPASRGPDRGTRRKGPRAVGPPSRSLRLTGKDRLGVRRQTADWGRVHIAIDNCARLAYAEVLSDQSRRTVIGFLRRAVAFYARHGITVQRVMTDNGGAYRSTIDAAACRPLKIRRLRTRAYRPQTNGKSERFIRTLLADWAYGAIYRSSTERTAALERWPWH